MPERLWLSEEHSVLPLPTDRRENLGLCFRGKAIHNEVQATELWLLTESFFTESHLDGSPSATQGDRER